jgi:transcriptional regulator with XRE-family HTH domain
MPIGDLSSQQAGAESANTNSIKQQMLESMKASKEYRHGFIEEAIRSRLTAQINALRNERGWDLKAFAEALGKKRAWAYRLEDPNESMPTVPSLLEVAETFDVGLDVRFRRFSEILEDATTLTPDSFTVPSFDSEVKNMAFGRPTKKRKIRSLSVIRSYKHKKAKKRLSEAQFKLDLGHNSAIADGGIDSSWENYGIRKAS